MSEEAKEPQAAPEAGAPAKAAKPAQPAIVVLAGVVLVALIIGSALGALVLAPRIIQSRQAAALAEAKDPHAKDKDKKKGKKKEKKKEGKEGEGKSPVYRLDNIIVNPANSDGQRFLMCSIAIQADDPAALDVLREHEIELRDRVVTLLAAETIETLTAAGARDSLRSRILTAIVPVLGEEGEGVELQVYLPQFVIQ
ncbi:MAG: flagellar basal body-associated FliL family protein [Burkholderiaceae bacterium]